MAAAKARGVDISVLLCTHKHWDHSGGNEAMKKMVRQVLLVCAYISAVSLGDVSVVVAVRDRLRSTYVQVGCVPSAGVPVFLLNIVLEARESHSVTLADAFLWTAERGIFDPAIPRHDDRPRLSRCMFIDPASSPWSVQVFGI